MMNAATTVTKNLRLSVAAFIFLTCIISISHAQNNPGEKPKAVSLDYCADQFILSLADREQIMALTPDAVEGHSFYRDKAQGLPLFRATSEEVLHMAPDVVIRNWGGLKMLPLLERANIPVASARYGTGPEILYQNMRLIGTALGQKERAERMIDDHRTRMAKLSKRVADFRASGHRIRAAYIAPGGVTAGENTFVNAIIKLAGLTSLSEELGLKGWQPLPLEAMVKTPPDLIIGSFFDLKNLHVSNWSLARHGRIRKMIDTIPTIMVPGRYLSCNGIFSVDAAEYIQNEVEKLLK